MSLYDVSLRAPVLDEAHELVTRNGMQVVVGHDFHEFKDRMALGRPHQIIGPPFDPELHELTEKTGFWVCGYTAQGRLAHTQAVRMVDIGDGSLGSYMMREFKQYPPVGIELNLEESRYRAGPGAKRIMGRVCYHGEMWLDPDAGEFRGRGFSAVLSRYGFALAQKKLNPDFIFAFMAKSVAHKGLAERAGFMHMEPGSLSWKLAGTDKAMEGFTGYLSRDDMDYLFELGIEGMIPTMVPSAPALAIAAE